MLGYVIKSFLARKAGNGLAVLSVGLIVGASVIALAFFHGLRDNLASTGRPDNVMVLSAAVLSAANSSVTLPSIEEVKALPGIALDGDRPLVSPELFLTVDIDEETFPLRAVDPVAYQVHDQVKIVDGRAPTAGSSEVMIGRRLLGRTPSLALGRTIQGKRLQFTVVGVFSAEGSVLEGEVWADRGRLAGVVGEDASVAVVRAGSSAGLPELLARIDAKAFEGRTGQVRLRGTPETQYYEATVGNVSLVRLAVAAIIAVLLIGAMFAAANTLHASFTSRMAEFAALWVVGFRRTRLGLLLVQEALLIGILAAVLGLLLAAPLAGSDVTSLIGGSVEFAIPFGLRQLADAFGLGLAVALLSSILPAVQLLRGNLGAALSE